jgi:hypothetical protein
MANLLFPVGTELLHPAVEFLSKLAVQLSRRLVTRRRRRDRRSQVSKGDLIKSRDCRLGPVEPGRLLD